MATDDEQNDGQSKEKHAVKRGVGIEVINIKFIDFILNKTNTELEISIPLIYKQQEIPLNHKSFIYSTQNVRQLY